MMKRPLARRIRIVAARLHETLGTAGLIGLILLVAAAVVAGLAWRDHHQPRLPDTQTASVAPTEQPVDSAARMVLPPPTEVPLILTRIQRAATDTGLGWAKADYRFSAASRELPASLEVRCGLKGPYLSIRRFVTALLQDEPTLTLREFSVERAAAEMADVEAKIVLVVYLAAGGAIEATGHEP